MTQHVLITGGAGFIGSRLANFLIAGGHNVKVLDNLSPQIHGHEPESSPLFLSLHDDVEFIRGSVTCRADLIKALQGVDTVVHLAAETGTGQSMYAIQHYSDVNIGGTALLLDLIANESFPIKRIVVASSRAVYGEGKYRCDQHGFVFPSARSAKDMEQGDFSVHCPMCGVSAELVATDEETPVRPSSVYGVTKLTQEQMVLTVAKALGISAIAFRYQNVYGPGQSLSNPYTGILSIFSTRIRNKSGINIFEDGKESRDFVFIDDVVAVTAKAVEHKQQIVDVFNVGSGVATDVLTIADTLQRLLGEVVPINVSGQFRVGDIRHNLADLTKIGEVMGFKPSVYIEDGLNRFVDWVKSEQVQVDRYEQSLAELKAKGLFK
ncbi:MAG: NAD-dependent epimerase/dehydratase family protein [Methylotenera sp.]|nr:NAD-dependent epimerase/dehydratase family protein [Methylotenera sp.]MDD4925325.1 NAD-dependent epimerase/dehydratase family protein [Methylotenera sp.]